MDSEKVLILNAVLLYIIKNSEHARCDVYGIVKTAYFTQQIHLAEHGSPIFDDNIAALQFGPVPSTIYDILKITRGDKRGFNFRHDKDLYKVADAITFSDEYFSAKEEPDTDYLSSSDIAALDKAISMVSQMDFSEIKSITHGREWNRAFKSKSKIMDLQWHL